MPSSDLSNTKAAFAFAFVIGLDVKHNISLQPFGCGLRAGGRSPARLPCTWLIILADETYIHTIVGDEQVLPDMPAYLRRARLSRF